MIENNNVTLDADTGDDRELLALANTMSAEDILLCANMVRHIAELEKTRGHEATLELVDNAIVALKFTGESQ